MDRFDPGFFVWHLRFGEEQVGRQGFGFELVRFRVRVFVAGCPGSVSVLRAVGFAVCFGRFLGFVRFGFLRGDDGDPVDLVWFGR